MFTLSEKLTLANVCAAAIRRSLHLEYQDFCVYVNRDEYDGGFYLSDWYNWETTQATYLNGEAC